MSGGDAIDLNAYWDAVFRQQADRMRPFFHPQAVIRWHNSNEQFTVEAFLRANCEYPGEWAGELLRAQRCGQQLITVVRIYPTDRAFSLHGISFFSIKEGRIAALDEYFSEDGPAPGWRAAMRIGRPIRADEPGTRVQPGLRRVKGEPQREE